MILSVQQAKFELLAYIKEFDTTFSSWCVGLAANPKQALFDVHGVRDEQDPWLYKQLLRHSAALIVRNHFVEHLGAVGAPDSEAADLEDIDCVFLYKIAQHTKQEA